MKPDFNQWLNDENWNSHSDARYLLEKAYSQGQCDQIALTESELLTHEKAKSILNEWQKTGYDEYSLIRMTEDAVRKSQNL